MKDKLANPAPLGLIGFGMTTVLLNIHNAGFFPISAMIMTMGLFVGGIGQIIAGIMEFKKGNTFGMTAFTSYGLFWITLVGIWVFPKMDLADPTPAAYLGWYLFLWGVFTFIMFLGTLKKDFTLKFVFGSLTVLFFTLAIRDWTGNELIGIVAGWEGILCGASAIYLAMAEILNETYQKNLLPT